MDIRDVNLKAIFDHAAVGIAQIGLDGTWMFANNRYHQMLGYSEAELRTKTLRDITHPEDYVASVAGRNQLLDGLVSSHSMEKRFIRKDGTVFWGRLHRSLVRDQENAPRFFIGIVEDISDKIRAERDLKVNEERFRLALNAGLGMWMFDLHDAGAALAPQYQDAFGQSPNSASEWLTVVHPDDRERVRATARQSLQESRDWETEFRTLLPDGSIRWLLSKGTMLFDDNGKPRGMTGVSFDITERKRAEAALRESEERFRRVFEEGPLGLALIGEDYGFIKVNSALCQMLGYDEAELVQLSFVDITHPDDVRAAGELAAQLFRREIPSYCMQKRCLKKTGEIVWINLTASIILGPDGEFLHGLGMIEDITEIKRTQQEALFRQKLESVGTLAGGIAHDFNNLLGAVEAQAELAQAELEAGSSCNEELNAICEVAKRGSEIVRQLMIYAGKENAVAERVNLSKIVEEMLALVKVSVSKHAVITADLGYDLPATRASAAQVRQIVMNLVTNASDAIGDRAGVIRVVTSRVGGESANAAESPLESDYVLLQVSDTGCGMSPETQNKLFDPFFTTKSPGRGLGLAVVSGIVRGLGGAIRLTSELGKGTSFEILLPCAGNTHDATVHSMATIEELAGPSQAFGVLVVEDEDVLRQAVAKMLRKSGFEVFEAADGSSAIDVLRTNRGKIDAILLDMTIPGASSREVVVEAANVRPDIRVVLTSAYGPEMFSTSTSFPQIRSFIRKPFQLADLVKTLRHSLVS